MIKKHQIQNLKSEILMLIGIDKNEEHIDYIYNAVDGLGDLIKAIEECKITTCFSEEWDYELIRKLVRDSISDEVEADKVYNMISDYTILADKVMAENDIVQLALMAWEFNKSQDNNPMLKSMIEHEMSKRGEGK